MLAASPSPSSLIDENELAARNASQENSELPSNDSSCIHSKLFHRRIVTMIETLTKPAQYLPTTPIPSPHVEQKSRPITFGQLRQATMSSASTTVVEEKPAGHLSTIATSGKPQRTFTAGAKDTGFDGAKSPIKHHSRHERLYYSPSLEKLFEEQNTVPQSKDENVEQFSTSGSPTTNLPSNLEPSISFSLAANNTTSLYVYPSVPRLNTLQNNQQTVPPPSVMNEQNQNRPPPPAYSSIVASNQRITPTGMYIDTLREP